MELSEESFLQRASEHVSRDAAIFEASAPASARMFVLMPTTYINRPFPPRLAPGADMYRDCRI